MSISLCNMRTHKDCEDGEVVVLLIERHEPQPRLLSQRKPVDMLDAESASMARIRANGGHGSHDLKRLADAPLNLWIGPAFGKGKPRARATR